MEKAGGASSSSSKAVCSKEAMELLNCVTKSPFDQEKCLLLMQSLRQCVLNKKVKKFTLQEESEAVTDPKSNKGS